MVSPVLVRRALLVCASVTVFLALFGAATLDHRFLLLLLPPSLTYFLLDAVRDAKHQKVLQAALDAKRDAARAKQAEEEAAAADGAGPKVPRGEGINRKKARRAKAA